MRRRFRTCIRTSRRIPHAMIGTISRPKIPPMGSVAASSVKRHPSSRIARLFDALAAAVHTGEFRGCPFSNALTELPGSRSVRAVAERYRTQQLDHIAALVGREPTDETVRAVVLLLEGATNVTKTTGSPEEILLARDVAVGLVTASAAPGRADARTQDR
jgi:hypothetical protein